MTFRLFRKSMLTPAKWERRLRLRALQGERAEKQSSTSSSSSEAEGGLPIAAGQSIDILDHIKAHGDWRDDQCPASS